MRYKINHHDKKAIIMTSKSTLDPSDFHSMDKKQTFKKNMFCFTKSYWFGM